MMRLILLIAAVLSTQLLFAQQMTSIEKKLVIAYNKIKDTREKGESDDLEKVNTSFSHKIKTMATKYPQTLTYGFITLKKAGVNIVNSPDRLVRIYSWDTETGGTMRFFSELFQYKTGEKVAADFDKDGAFWRALFQFSAGKKTYYLASWLEIGSTKDHSAGINIYEIKNGKLRAVKIIKTESGLTNGLSYEYDFFSIVDRKVRPEPSFNVQTQTISIPVVDEHGKVTDSWIRYKFNGEYFVKVK